MLREGIRWFTLATGRDQVVHSCYGKGSGGSLFNLGMATAAVQTLEPGVYIAMSGQVFPAGQVRKNKSLGVFESTEKHPNTEGLESENGTLRITKRKMTGFFR